MRDTFCVRCRCRPFFKPINVFIYRAQPLISGLKKKNADNYPTPLTSSPPHYGLLQIFPHKLFINSYTTRSCLSYMYPDLPLILILSVDTDFFTLKFGKIQIPPPPLKLGKIQIFCGMPKLFLILSLLILIFLVIHTDFVSDHRAGLEHSISLLANLHRKRNYSMYC